jgi:hypothetical protein
MKSWGERGVRRTKPLTALRPYFVTDTKLEPGARIVTFINGMVPREPIVTLDDEARRLVWTHEGGRARHYNGALQVSELADGLTSVVWTAISYPTTLVATCRRQSKREWRRCSGRWTRWRRSEGLRGAARQT